MSFEERQQIVATVEETYALMGVSLGAGVNSDLINNGVRPDVLAQLANAAVDPYVTDSEMRELLIIAYNDLLESVLRLSPVLLGDSGETFDGPLRQVGLAGSGLRVKVSGFRRALGRLPGIRWVKKAFQWGNIILGSLGAVPGVGIITEPIQELKESIEAQGEEDQGD